LPTLYRYFLPWADALVAVSKGVARDLAAVTGISPERIKVIYNPVISDDFFDSKGLRCTHPWAERDQPPLFIAVGRLVAQKDFHTLIRAFAQLRASHVARLMIVGDGALRNSLEQTAEMLGIVHDVTFVQFVRRPQDLIERSVALILSSVHEGFGNVLVEALAVGVPVVATDCPHGPSEILDGGTYGKLVRTGSPEELANAMENVLTSGDRIDHEALRKRAHEFTLEKHIAAYLTLFRELLPHGDWPIEA
jgi:glycosyltransferase involved in cell wall biosynthesis